MARKQGGGLEGVGLLALGALLLLAFRGRRGSEEGAQPPATGPSQFQVVAASIEGEASPVTKLPGDGVKARITYRHRGKGGIFTWALVVHDRPWGIAAETPGIHTADGRWAATAAKVEPDRPDWSGSLTVDVTGTLPTTLSAGTYDVWAGRVEGPPLLGTSKREGAWKDDSLVVVEAVPELSFLDWAWL